MHRRHVSRSGNRSDAERFIRILKESLLWMPTFITVEGLRRVPHPFKRTDTIVSGSLAVIVTPRREILRVAQTA